MSIDRIRNIEQEAIRIKDWVGWKVGWMTGWYNPFDRFGDLINPAELGRLIEIQGEYLQRQGQIVQELGGRLNEFARGANLRSSESEKYEG